MKIDKTELKELFIEIRHNNKIAFEKFYNKYNKLVYGIAFSILKNEEDAEEIVQNTFLKIYQLDKEKLPNNNESSWLYSITKHESLILLRKKKIEIDIDKIYNIKYDDVNIEKIIDRDCYNKLISKLSEEEKEIVSLKIIGNFSFDEIGKILNKSPNTIKWKYYKSIKSIKFTIGSLFMFVLTFIIGKVLEKLEIEEKNKISIEENNTIEKEEETHTDTDSNTTDIYIKGEDENNIIEDEKEIQNNTSETYTVVQEIHYIESLQTLKTSLFTFSYIFLILFLIFLFFFIKHQLKFNKKASK